MFLPNRRFTRGLLLPLPRHPPPSLFAFACENSVQRTTTGGRQVREGRRRRRASAWLSPSSMRAGKIERRKLGRERKQKSKVALGERTFFSRVVILSLFLVFSWLPRLSRSLPSPTVQLKIAEFYFSPSHSSSFFLFVCFVCLFVCLFVFWGTG